MGLGFLFWRREMGWCLPLSVICLPPSWIIKGFGTITSRANTKGTWASKTFSFPFNEVKDVFVGSTSIVSGAVGVAGTSEKLSCLSWHLSEGGSLLDSTDFRQLVGGFPVKLLVWYHRDEEFLPWVPIKFRSLKKGSIVIVRTSSCVMGGGSSIVAGMKPVHSFWPWSLVPWGF